MTTHGPGREPDDEAIGRNTRKAMARYEVPSSTLAGSSRHPGAGDAIGVVARAAFVVVIAVLVLTVVRPLWGQQGVGTTVPTPSPTLAPSPVLSPTAAPTSAPATSVGIDLALYAWFEISAGGPCPNGVVSEPLSDCLDPGAPTLATITLEAATLDGRYGRTVERTLAGVSEPEQLERAQPRAVLGDGAVVFYTANDANGGSVRSLTLVDGADVEVFRSVDLVTAVANDESDGSLLVALVSAGKRVDRGVWRVDPATGTALQVVEARTDLDMTRRANGWQPRIYLAPGGDRLVTLDCMDWTCEARVIDARTGTQVSDATGLRDEEVYGISANELVGIFDCPQRPCPISALDLGTGALAPLVTSCEGSSAAIAEGGQQPALLGVGPVPATCAAGSVSSVSTDAGATNTVWTATGSDTGLLVVERNAGLGYSAAPGWIALGPGGGIRPATGETVAARMLDLTTGMTVAIVLPTP